MSDQGKGNKKIHVTFSGQVIVTERTLEIHGIFFAAQQPNSNLNADLHV